MKRDEYNMFVIRSCQALLGSVWDPKESIRKLNHASSVLVEAVLHISAFKTM